MLKKGKNLWYKIEVAESETILSIEWDDYWDGSYDDETQNLRYTADVEVTVGAIDESGDIPEIKFFNLYYPNEDDPLLSYQSDKPFEYKDSGYDTEARYIKVDFDICNCTTVYIKISGAFDDSEGYYALQVAKYN